MANIEEMKPRLAELMRGYRHDGWIRYIDLHALNRDWGDVRDIRSARWYRGEEASHKSSLYPYYDWLCFKVELEPLLEDIAKALGCSPVDILLSIEEA